MPGPHRVAIVGAALSDVGRVDDRTPYELHFQATKRARVRHSGWPGCETVALLGT